jgi:hypothetical protein
VKADAAMSDEAPRFGGRRYPLELFDRHLCLKAPWPLLLGTVFLCRGLLLRFVYALSNIKGRGADISMLWSGEFERIFLFGSLPAFFVLASYARRSPRSGPAGRWIWQHGAWFIGVSAVVQCLPAVWVLGEAVDPFSLHFEESPLLLVVNAGIAGYAFFSRRARDAFSDLPEPQPLRKAAPTR